MKNVLFIIFGTISAVFEKLTLFGGNVNEHLLSVVSCYIVTLTRKVLLINIVLRHVLDVHRITCNSLCKAGSVFLAKEFFVIFKIYLNSN